MQGQISEIAALNKTSLDAALDVALVLGAGLDKVARLQLEAGRSLLREAAEAGRSFAWGGSLAELAPKPGLVAAASIDKAVGYSRNLYDIAAGTSVQLLELFSTASADLRKRWLSVAEGMSESIAMGRNGPTSAAFKSAASATDAIVEGLTKTARQSIELAESTLKAAASAASGGHKGAGGS